MNTISRPDTYAFLGEDIHVGMAMNLFYEALQRGMQNYPEIYAILDLPFQAVQVVYQMMQPIQDAYQLIIDIEAKLKIAKRVLELAVKVYNMQVTVQTGLLKAFPITGNGAPMAFPGGDVLAPLSAAIETATQTLQDTEDYLDFTMTLLVTASNEFMQESYRVQNFVMDTIIEAGNFKIELEAVPPDDEG